MRRQLNPSWALLVCYFMFPADLAAQGSQDSIELSVTIMRAEEGYLYLWNGVLVPTTMMLIGVALILLSFRFQKVIFRRRK